MTTKKEALAAGAKRYDMTRPCKRGHLAQRYTSCDMCCLCVDLKQANKKALWLAARRLHNTKLFEPAQVYSTIARPAHHAMYDDLTHVCAFGTAEQVDQCEAFIGMIRAQVIAPITTTRPPGELDRAALAAVVNLDPGSLGYLDGSPLAERWAEDGTLHINVAGLWYVATQLAEVWKGVRIAVRPVGGAS